MLYVSNEAAAQEFSLLTYNHESYHIGQTKVADTKVRLLFSKCQNHKEDGANLCGLLRKAELLRY